MRIQPYLPAGVDSVPGKGVTLIVAPGTAGVEAFFRVDETTADQPLSTDDPFIEFPVDDPETVGELTLRKIQISVAAAQDTSLKVEATADGWNSFQSITLSIPGDDTVRSLLTGFNVTGHDIRIRFVFVNPIPVLLYRYQAHVEKRSDHD